MLWCRWEGNDLILRLRVSARASRDGFVGVVNDCLRVRIAAAPVQGQANAELKKFLAKRFGVAKQHVRLLQGEKSKTKLVRIQAPAKIPSDLGILGPD
jgi:uncharacterized protein (TIGR00251 family)